MSEITHTDLYAQLARIEERVNHSDHDMTEFKAEIRRALFEMRAEFKKEMAEFSAKQDQLIAMGNKVKGAMFILFALGGVLGFLFKKIAGLVAGAPIP